MSLKNMTALSLLLVFSIFGLIFFAGDFPNDEQITRMIRTAK